MKYIGFEQWEPKGWIYMLEKDGEIRYIGQTENLSSRIKAHRKDGKEFDTVWIQECELTDMDKMEMRYIRMYSPEINKIKGKIGTRKGIRNGIKRKQETETSIIEQEIRRLKTEIGLSETTNRQSQASITAGWTLEKYKTWLKDRKETLENKLKTLTKI